MNWKNNENGGIDILPRENKVGVGSNPVETTSFSGAAWCFEWAVDPVCLASHTCQQVKVMPAKVNWPT